MPAYYALSVNDPEQPDIQLPYGQLRPDGMALEFTVDPTNDVPTIVDRLRENLKATQQIAARESSSVLSLEPQFYTHQWYIDHLPPTYGDACSLQILGCAPDKCVYTKKPMERPDPKTYNYRTLGGHIHIGVGQDMASDFAAINFTVAALDIFIGTAGTYLCRSEQAFERKKLYGKAGYYRASDSRGTIEYRVLPAQALIQTREIATLMFTTAQQVCAYMMDMYASLRQPEFVATCRRVLGSFAYLANDVGGAINDHDIGRCYDLQGAGARSINDSILDQLVNKLQLYRLPEHFNLAWGDELA